MSFYFVLKKKKKKLNFSKDLIFIKKFDLKIYFLFKIFILYIFYDLKDFLYLFVLNILSGNYLIFQSFQELNKPETHKKI
jgi:hypothetical protein